MKWSKYNHILESKYGIFIYNSVTNSFLKINEAILYMIRSIKDWNIGKDNFDKELQEVFLSHRILVEDNFDHQYLTKLKFIHERIAFANSHLVLTIATTTDCNFMCPYCYETGINGQVMNEKTEQAIIDYVSSIKPRTIHITWYGGEPLMNFGSIKRLTEKIGNINYLEKIEYGMVTNGSLLTENMCRFFADHNLKSVQITIDGLEENHNKSRVAKNGKSSYHVILNNLDKAIEILPDCRFVIRVNINLSNKEDYPVLYRALHERYKGKSNFSIYFSFVEDYNVCRGITTLNSKEKIEFLGYLKNVHQINEKLYPSRESGICPACTINSFVIAPNGDLYKCWNEIGRKNFIVGNISDKKLISNYELICEYAVNYNKFNDPKCLDCFLFPVCTGGCPSNRYSNQTKDTSLEICPYHLDNIDTTLELMYERVLALSNEMKACTDKG